MPEPVLSGSVEFSVMTTDVNQEVAFQIMELGQRRGEEAGGVFIFIYAGLWSAAKVKRDKWEEITAAAEAGLIPPWGHYYFESFDPPLKAENGRFYDVRIEWDGVQGPGGCGSTASCAGTRAGVRPAAEAAEKGRGHHQAAPRLPRVPARGSLLLLLLGEIAVRSRDEVPS